MIDLFESLWNLAFSLASSLLLCSLLSLRNAAMSMAVSSTSPTPPSPSLPWKRFAEPPLLVSKRSKDSPGHVRPPHHAGEGAAPEMLHPGGNIPAPAKLLSEDTRQVHLGLLPGKEEVRATSGALVHGGCSEERIGDGEDVQRKALVRTPAVMTLPAARAGGGNAAACPRVRRRPTRIVIPQTDVGCGFGEVGKVESDGEFHAEGSCYCVAGRRGNRRVMEDGYGVMTNIKGNAKQAQCMVPKAAHQLIQLMILLYYSEMHANLCQAYFGVFDGHGGRAAVDYVSEKLGENIIAALGGLEREGKGDPGKAMVEGYLTTDKEFLSQGVASGVCAATVLLKDGKLHAANVGDCRVVMSRKGVATVLTEDHRPERENERLRIENSGGYISCHNGVRRVQGSLAISRAIGDLHMKDWIISEPETTSLGLTSDCEFLIIASDGLWDKVSSQEAVDVVTEHKVNPLASCKKLVDISYSRGSKDDITVMVVDLQRFTQAR